MKFKIEEGRNKNFTRDDYIKLVLSYKKPLQDVVNSLEDLANKHLDINQKGDYNAVLNTKDKETLYKNSALLGNLERLMDAVDYLNRSK